MKTRKIVQGMFCLLFILAAGNASAANGAGEGIRPIPDVPRSGTVSVPHEIVPVINFSGYGKVELDLTAHQIIFTDLGDNGGLHLKLFQDEEYERLPFSIVYTVKKVPFLSGRTYKLLLSSKESFTLVYFRVYEGKVTVKRPFD